MIDAHLLRYIIRKNGDTVDGLADAMGISRATLSAKMNNKREFKLSEIIYITRKYKIPYEIATAVFGGGQKCG